MTNDEMEAQSRRYSNDHIVVLPLKSGNLAVFNRAYELCGIIENKNNGRWTWNEILGTWHRPSPPPLSQERQEGEDILRSAGL